MLRGFKFPWHILKAMFESKMAFINSSSFSQSYLMAVYPVLSYFCLSSRNSQQSSIENTKFNAVRFFWKNPVADFWLSNQPTNQHTR